MITTQKELRAEFWRQSGFRREGTKTQNDYAADVRVAWCVFVESMHRAGEISAALVQRATL